MAKKMKFSLKSPVESLDCDEIEDDGFSEDVGDNPNALVTFSFINDSSKVPNSSLPLGSIVPLNISIPKMPVDETKPPVIVITKVPLESKKASSLELVDTRTLQLQPNGITPPINGEYFEIRRTFMFRRSTVRMLNKIKAEHPDENVYLSSIVDEAIRNYYEIVFNKVGS